MEQKPVHRLCWQSTHLSLLSMWSWSIHRSPVYVEWLLQYGGATKVTVVNRDKSTSRCRIEENMRLSGQWILIFHLTDTQFVLSLFLLVEYNLNQHDQNKYHFNLIQRMSRCHLLFSNGVDGWCSLIVFLFFFTISSPHLVLSCPIQFRVPYQWYREQRQLTSNWDNIHQPSRLKVHEKNESTLNWPTTSPGPLSHRITFRSDQMGKGEYLAPEGEPAHIQSLNYRMIFGLTWFQGGLSFVGSVAPWVI